MTDTSSRAAPAPPDRRGRWYHVYYGVGIFFAIAVSMILFVKRQTAVPPSQSEVVIHTLLLLLVASIFAVGVRMARERDRVTAALRASEAYFRGTFDSAAIGMSVTSPDGRILRANASWCRTLGYTEAELIGRDARTIIHPDDLAGTMHALAGALADAGKRRRPAAPVQAAAPSGIIDAERTWDAAARSTGPPWPVPNSKPNSDACARRWPPGRGRPRPA